MDFDAPKIVSIEGLVNYSSLRLILMSTLDVGTWQILPLIKISSISFKYRLLRTPTCIKPFT